MSSDSESDPLDACALPGTVTVTRSAIMLAQQFQTVTPAGWIVTFWWYDGGRIRRGKDAPWVETGSGVDLGAYRMDEIPKEALCYEGSFRYAVLIRQEIVEQHPQRTIDLDGSGKIVFR